MTNPSLLSSSALELARRVRAGELSAEALTRASLDAIAAENGALGAFLSVAGERALEVARGIDLRRERGEALGPLAGVPVGVKDVLATTDLPTTAASRILLRELGAVPDASRGYVSPYDATAVARLRAADAVIVGKCNLDELAMGSSSETSAFFPVRNPLDPSRTPGGSSGGSAVAVAAGMVPLSLGTDTGGSVRQPASLTGTVGFKPSYGRVSRYGLFAFASSLDQVGSFARDVRGAARLTEIVAGHDPLDATSLDAEVGDLVQACDGGLEGLRVGVPREAFAEGTEPEVEARVREALERMGARGARIVPISLPSTKHAIATYYVLATAEASSNLARYDGVRFGLRVHDGASPLGELYAETRGRGFGAEVKRRIILGTFVLSAGYYDAYYLRAQRARRLVCLDYARAFDEVDVVVSPTSPVVAFELGSRTSDPLAMYAADACTLPASLAGLPALSLPCGVAEPPGGGPKLPVGLQIVGPPRRDDLVLRAAAAYEELGA